MDRTAMTGLVEKQKGTGRENQEMEEAQGIATAHATKMSPIESPWNGKPLDRCC